MSGGKFISFEGGEGSGKTTQIARLAEWLRSRGHDVVTTREPGGTEGAEAIRALLVEGEPGRWSGRTEALLMNAARSDHVEQLVRPALADGQWVLSDRYAHSTLAYQGAARGLVPDELIALHYLATEGLWPDLTILLDVPVDIGLGRASKRAGKETRFEDEGEDFHEDLRQGFLDVAAVDDRIAIIDASEDEEAVWAAVLSEVEARLDT